MKRKETTEDYLKTIYLMAKNGEVRCAALAAELNVSNPTVCISLKALEQEGYLCRKEDRSVVLTAAGLAVAQDTYRRNCMLRRLLACLGVEQQIAERDACAMEHALSEASYEALRRMACQLEEKQTAEEKTDKEQSGKPQLSALPVRGESCRKTERAVDLHGKMGV